MNSTTALKTLPLALIAMNLFSACIIDNYEYETTTTTTERPDRAAEKEVIVDDEVIIDEVIIHDDFQAHSASIQSTVIDMDPRYPFSSQLYELTFSEIKGEWACHEDAANMGSTAHLNLYGYEVQDEFSACPVGSYTIVADCELSEGEACMDLLRRDNNGVLYSEEWPTFGMVIITMEPARFHGEPHLCHISTAVHGKADLSLDFTTYFESYDLSPESDQSGPICTAH